MPPRWSFRYALSNVIVRSCTEGPSAEGSQQSISQELPSSLNLLDFTNHLLLQCLLFVNVPMQDSRRDHFTLAPAWQDFQQALDSLQCPTNNQLQPACQHLVYANSVDQQKLSRIRYQQEAVTITAGCPKRWAFSIYLPASRTSIIYFAVGFWVLGPC